MTIYMTPQGRAELHGTPEEIDLVPSKREATNCLARLLASLSEDQCERYEREIMTVMKFVWSR